LNGAELIAVPSLNQGLVRFISPVGDHDRYTDTTIAAINAEGTAFFSGTTFQGRRAMRISVINWRTNETDVRRAIDAVARVLANRSQEANQIHRSTRVADTEPDQWIHSL